MAHGLEQRDGQVTFALRGAPAWHGLAEKIFGEDDAVNTQEMLDSALLSRWNVRLENIPLPDVPPTRYLFTRNPDKSKLDLLTL